MPALSSDLTINKYAIHLMWINKKLDPNQLYSNIYWSTWLAL